MKVLLRKFVSLFFIAIVLCGLVQPARAGDCFYDAAKSSGYQDIYTAINPCKDTLHTGAFVPGAGDNFVGCADINVVYIEKYYGNYGYKSSSDFTSALLADACLQQKVAAQVLKDACAPGASVGQRVCGYYTGQCVDSCDQVRSVAVKSSVGYVGSVLSAKVADLWNKILGTSAAIKKSISAAAVVAEVDGNKAPVDTCAQLFDGANSIDFMEAFKKSMTEGKQNVAVAAGYEIDKVKEGNSGDVSTEYCIEALKAYVVDTIGGPVPGGDFATAGNWAGLKGTTSLTALDGTSCLTKLYTQSAALCLKLADYKPYSVYGSDMTLSSEATQCIDVNSLKTFVADDGKMCIPSGGLDELLAAIKEYHAAGGKGDIGANNNPKYEYIYKK